MTAKRIEDMTRTEFIRKYQYLKDSGVPTEAEIAQAEKALGLTKGTVRRRVNTYGWPWSKAMTVPLQTRAQASRKGAGRNTFHLRGTQFIGTRSETGE